MKKGLVLALAFAVLAVGMTAVHCGGGARDDLATLELRAVLGLEDEDVQYFFHNERLSAYDAMVATALEQAREITEAMEAPAVSGDITVVAALKGLDQERAKDKEAPLVFVSIRNDQGQVTVHQPLTEEDAPLLNPVAFMDTVPAKSDVEFVYPEGVWSEEGRDDLLGHSELGVLNWLEPWLAALGHKVSPATTIQVIRAEGLTSFVAMGPAPDEMRINPVLLHMAAAQSHAVSAAAADNPRAAVAPGYVAGAQSKNVPQGHHPRVIDVPAVQPDGAAETQQPLEEMAGQLTQVEQEMTDADLTACTCTCMADEESEGEDTHVCGCDCDEDVDYSEDGEQNCVYGCADDPSSCATVSSNYSSWYKAKRTYMRVFNWGALVLPGLVLLGWVRRIRRRDQ